MDWRLFVLGFAFVIGSAAGAFAATAERFSAGNLADYCASPYDVDAGYCAGYVAAVAGIMADQPIYGLRACNHQSVRSQQLMEIVGQELARDPAKSAAPARVMVAGTIAKAFPCP